MTKFSLKGAVAPSAFSLPGVLFFSLVILLPLVLPFIRRASPVFLVSAALLICIHVIWHGQWRESLKELSPCAVTLGACFLFWAGLTSFWAPVVSRSWHAVGSGSLIFLSGLCLLFYQWERSRRIDLFLAIAISISSLIIFIDLTTGDMLLRLVHSRPEPYRYNMVLVSLLVFSFGLFQRGLKLSGPLNYIALLVLLGAAFVSESETAKLAILVSYFSLFSSHFMPRMISIFCSAIAVIAAWAIFLLDPLIVEDVGQLWPVLAEQGHLIERIQIWAAYSKMAQAGLPWGWGVESVSSVPLTKYFVMVPEATRQYIQRLHPHNQLIQIAVEMGWIGIFIGFATNIWMVFWAHADEHLRPARVGLLVTIMIVALVSHGFWQMWWWSSLAIGCCFLKRKRDVISTASNRITILQAYKTCYPDVYGGIPYIIEIIRNIRPDIFKHQVLVCGKQQASDDFLGIERVRSFGSLLSLPIAPAYPLTLWSRSCNAHIVLMHAPFPLADLILAFALPRSTKLIVFWHADIISQKYMGKIMKPLIRRTLKRASAIIISDPEFLKFSKYLKNFSDKCIIAPLPVSASRFAESNLRFEFLNQIRKNYPRLVLACGRLVYYKGFEVLIEASRNIDGQVLIIGDGPERAKLQDHIDSSGVSGHVKLLGNVSEDEFVHYLSAAKVFVLPSITEAETFGVSQLEAMAAGKAVVNTSIPTAVPKVARHNIEGLTVEPRNPIALALAVNSILQNEILGVQLGNAARERALNTFGMKEFEKIMTATLQDVFCLSNDNSFSASGKNN